MDGWIGRMGVRGREMKQKEKQQCVGLINSEWRVIQHGCVGHASSQIRQFPVERGKKATRQNNNNKKNKQTLFQRSS